ncbi:hypothetical protein GCM10022403_010090 [Streptomyces coacervatus]|uniref:Uncharacterized protein n=1 Tax=Streptomyces coacervatus TaxID=647381 RepID=A0ABP7GZ06_9ACTN
MAATAEGADTRTTEAAVAIAAVRIVLFGEIELADMEVSLRCTHLPSVNTGQEKGICIRANSAL